MKKIIILLVLVFFTLGCDEVNNIFTEPSFTFDVEVISQGEIVKTYKDVENPNTKVIPPGIRFEYGGKTISVVGDYILTKEENQKNK